MLHEDRVRQRYLGPEYLERNPTWDLEDSPWKVDHVLRMMRAHNLVPSSIAEVGCGAGAVLGGMRRAFPDARLYGFDIAPGAAKFWEEYAEARIEFALGDFFEQSDRRYDLLLLLDVIEHLSNPFDFLSRLRGHAAYFLFHFPLDLSAVSVLREQPLLHVRRKVGHIHYFTKGLVLALLEECGYQVRDWFYTGAAFSAPQRSWKTRFVSMPRRMVYALARDVGVRLFGGETVMVLADSRNAL
jgi:SAM-dependent methyltransferase